MVILKDNFSILRLLTLKMDTFQEKDKLKMVPYCVKAISSGHVDELKSCQCKIR